MDVSADVVAAQSAEMAANTLTRAVHVVFGEWTALKLAVENEFSGSGTRERALALLQRVLTALLSNATVHRDELEDLLDLALLDDFNIEAEDESPKEVAMLLCQLHSEAKSGVTTTAELLFARAATKGKSWVEVPPPPRAKTDDSSDDDMGSGDEDGGGGGGGGGSSSAMDAEMSGEPREPAPPVVDEDGFQMVSPRRGRGRK